MFTYHSFSDSLHRNHRPVFQRQRHYQLQWATITLLLSVLLAAILSTATSLSERNFTSSSSLPPIASRKRASVNECPLMGVSFPCNPQKYRSFSGHCNNVQNPEWGSANMPYLRYLPPNYSDGVSGPRKSITGEELTSARTVSVLLNQGSDIIHPHTTILTTFFMEFVFHDLAETRLNGKQTGRRIKCCDVDPVDFHSECFPIDVEQGDPILGRFGQRCMEYVRAAPMARIGSCRGPREQVNQVTSFLDGSVIYGSSEEEVNSMRKFQGGQLKSQRFKDGRSELLPAEEKKSNHECRSNDLACFKSGDRRANENIGLTLMHTLWHREHNRIARQLAKLNTHWDDNQLFLEARRIVTAELQHITYNELLPMLLGDKIVDDYDLRPLTSGFYSNYDMDLNPAIDNSVATAIFNSIIYSMLPSAIERYTSDLNRIGLTAIGQTWSNPSDLYDTKRLGEYMMAMISQNTPRFDLLVSNEVSNIINGSARQGIDLMAMAIQAGRDHGLPSYLEHREACRVDQVQITSFTDLNEIMPTDAIRKMKKLYKSVKDIDLIIGGMAEFPVDGALVGPTFACLLAKQFHSLRRGDRFWYENDVPPSAFTKEQLSELRKATIARIVCDNSDSTEFVQPSSLVASDPYLNAFQYCNTGIIPQVDLSPWRTLNPTKLVSETLIKESLARAKRQFEALRETERVAFAKRFGIAAPHSPQSGHFGFLRPKRQAQILSNQSLLLEIASNGIVKSLLRNGRDREVGRSLNLEMQDLIRSLPQIELTNLVESDTTTRNVFLNPLPECDEDFLPCDPTSPFRTVMGWCNNLKNPEYGKSLRITNRIMPPAYEDGISSMRQTALNGKPLPNPRVISTTIHADISAPHVRYSLAVMQWGQFLDHDLTFTPMNEGVDRSILDCSSCDSQKTVHHECAPIPIPPNDPHFPSRDETTKKPKCLHFVRSLNAQTTLGPRQQMNQVTAYIDASNVYGSDPCDAKMLRAHEAGRLNTTKHRVRGMKDLLPETNNNPECRAPSGVCFEAGDFRASEQPGLASIHTMFMREHNRIVDGLAKVNPQWDDETLYQTGRKIMGAIAQQVTYGEWLPRVLGRDYMARFELNLLPNGYYDQYDSDCSATLFNEFSAAVLRFGHSLLRPSFQRLDRNYRPIQEPLQLRRGFFNSDMLYAPQAMDHVIRGLVSSSMEALDSAVTNEVKNHLFEDQKVPFSGMDLVSLNIQRARDHGIPPYNMYREFCNLTRAKTFEDLTEVPKPIIAKLKRVYESVDDIDLFTGGLSESPLHGGLVGPTFGCILGLQMQRLRKCDRFWYETNDKFIRFTEGQLTEIRKMSLAKVLCENADTIDTIQRHVLDIPDPFLNPKVPCNSLPTINFNEWRDHGKMCIIKGRRIPLGKTAKISPCVTCACTKEGAECQSMKIANCMSLLSEYSQKAILRDPVCRVQCTYVFVFSTLSNSSNQEIRARNENNVSSRRGSNGAGPNSSSVSSSFSVGPPSSRRNSARTRSQQQSRRTKPVFGFSSP